MNARQFESTDDAFVEMHLDPISARVDGTITKVYVEDNQIVHAGDPLVDLDPRDFQVSIDQATAALNQARSQVIAQQPNVPITQAENTANVSSGEAGVANADAGVSAAEHDRDTAVARLAEAEANNAKAQADLSRYKILIAKEEVSKQEYDQVEAAAKAQAAEWWIREGHRCRMHKAVCASTGRQPRSKWRCARRRFDRRKRIRRARKRNWSRRG
jgi:membrane fusion protein (multidrug efflux system)